MCAPSELVPLADNLDCIFLPSLLVCAPSADREATLPQSTFLQVHLITHIERRVLQMRIKIITKSKNYVYILLSRK